MAAQSDAVAAVAPFEPRKLSLADERVQAVIGNAVARTGELAAQGNLAAAARAFAAFPFHDEEIAVAEQAGYFEAAGRYVPNILNLLQQAMTGERPVTDDPAVLGAIKAPVAVLLGSDTKPFFTPSVRAMSSTTSPMRACRRSPASGTPRPLTHPEALASAITEFFPASPELQLQL